MIGALFGDIVGSLYEFRNIRTKDFNVYDKRSFFTDDSVCTIAFMDWLLHSKERTEDDAIYYLQKWTRKYPDVSYGGRFMSWIWEDSPKPYYSCGNGSAMRISAVAWAAKDYDELEKLVTAATSITHNHPEGIKGALVTARCIYMALHCATIDEIRDYAIKEYPIIKTFDYEELRKYYGFYEICQESVPQAIYCFLISNSFIDCAKTTISIGGDCDTTAAISCAIAEAYYGVTKKDYDFVSTKLSDEMKEVVDEFNLKYCKMN